MKKPSKKKKMVDHGDHFKVHTEGGDMFTIAKKGLHPSTVKHFQKLYCGGDVQKFAEKGLVEPEEGKAGEAPPSDGWDAGAYENEETIQAGMPKVSAQMAANQKESDDAAYAEQRMNDGPKMDSPGQEIKPDDFGPVTGSPISKTAESAGDMPPGAQPEAPAVTSDNAQMGKFVAARVKDITPQEIAAKDAANAGRTANAAEQERIAGDVGKANQESAKAQQDLQASSDIHLAEVNKRAAALREGIENGKIDPDHYWHEKGTGGRIAASIGLLLSGLGSGLGGGPNMAMKVIQDNIDRDLKAQQENLNTKKSLLADCYRETGDIRLAHQMAAHTLTVVAQAKLNTLAAQSSSSQVKAAAQVANAVADQTLAQQGRGIADRRAANQANAANANTAASNALVLQKAKAGDALKTPREMQGAKISNLESAKQDLIDLKKKMDDNMFSGPVGNAAATLLPFSRYSKSGASNLAEKGTTHALTEKLATALGGGAATSERIKEIGELMYRPSDTAQTRKEKHEALLSLIDTQLSAYKQQQGGVGNKVAAPSQFTPAKPKGF